FVPLFAIADSFSVDTEVSTKAGQAHPGQRETCLRWRLLQSGRSRLVVPTDARFRTTGHVRGEAARSFCLARPARLPREPGVAARGYRSLLHAVVHRTAADPHTDCAVRDHRPGRATGYAGAVSRVADPGTIRGRCPTA